MDLNQLDGIYRGVIEDNNDPEKLGRCRVRVFGIHSPNKTQKGMDGIPTEDLPWAEPVMGLFEGSVSGFGSWIIPLQGSHVFLFFEGGNPLQPRFFATVPGKPKTQTHGFIYNQGFSDPDKTYPNKTTTKPHKPNALEESDFHRLSRGETKDTIVDSKTENKNSSEPDPYYAAEYPHNKVFSTNSGITIEIDDTPDEERIHVYHPSNSYIEIDKNGNIIIRNASNKFEIVDADKLKYVSGDYTLYVGGKLYISAENGIDMWGGGNINEDAPQIHLNDGIASKKKEI